MLSSERGKAGRGLVFYLLGCFFILTAVLSLIDAVREDYATGAYWAAVVIDSLIAAAFITLGIIRSRRGWLIRPVMIDCPCGYKGPARPYVDNSPVLEILLWGLLFIPGMIYSAWLAFHQKYACPECRRMKGNAPVTEVSIEGGPRSVTIRMRQD